MIVSGLAVGGATAGAGIFGQNAEYNNAVANRNAQAAFMNQRYLETAEAVEKDVNLQTDVLFRQYDQVRQQSFAQIRAVAADARRGMAVTAARNAERGIKGRSAEAAIDEFERDFLDFENLRLTELKDRRAQMSLEAQAIHARGQSVINGAYPSPLPTIQGGSILVPILQGATAGLAVAGSLAAISNSSALAGLGTQSASTTTSNMAVAPGMFT
jgi:hypothetical protein